LATPIKEFLSDKMVFLGGPRQVGKTTLCLSFLKPPEHTHSAYLNWDDLSTKKQLRRGELPVYPLLVLDEIHKYKNWRNLVKGFYDKKKNIQKYLVTGSARLDYYRRGGDSLMGRYRYLRLHPFSVSELDIVTQKDLAQLLQFGGFPEPFLKASKKEWRLWQNERLYRLVNDDIRDLENLRELQSIETLAEALPSKVGSPISVNSLAEDLEFNFRTIENWIKILERMYYCFRIPPFGSSKIKAVKKEKKLYLWDWSACESMGAKFENCVASHLLKYCHFLEDTEGFKMELRYLRDVSKREIDFVVLEGKKPIFAVECKSGEEGLSPHIPYFKARTSIPAFYQVHLGTKDFSPAEGIRVLPFLKFCKDLQLK
jgi:predicted AAA+ superfamily ATPase